MLTIISITGAVVVAIGAFGAHGLKPLLTEDQLTTYHTGVSYHFYHLMAMCFTFLWVQHSDSIWAKRAFWAFLIGIIMFSGSLYLLSIREVIGLSSYRWLGPITPIGGLSFILAWIFLGISANSNYKK